MARSSHITIGGAGLSANQPGLVQFAAAAASPPMVAGCSLEATFGRREDRKITEATSTAVSSPVSAAAAHSHAAVELRGLSAARGGNKRPSRKQKSNPGGNTAASRVTFRRTN